MVVEYIRYSVEEDRADAFEQAYRRASDSLDKSEHCERYEVARCREIRRACRRIEWDSEEGHLSGFRRSAEFGLDAVGPFVQDIEEMRHYEVRLSSD